MRARRHLGGRGLGGRGIGQRSSSAGFSPSTSIPAAPSAPTLTHTTGGDDSTPEFILDGDLVVGDTVRFQYDTHSNFSAPAEITNAIDAGEAAANQLSFSTSALADGTWYFRARIERPVSGNSDWSNTETLTLATETAPANTVAPVISGNVRVGQTLSTTDGTWTGTATIVFTYQWKRGASNIASATNSTYLLAEADAGQAITCVVTGTNGVGNSTGTSNTLTIDVYAVLTAHVEDATDQTTYSGGVWNGVAIGVAAANRVVVVVPDARGGANNTLSTATIAGNALVQRLRVTSDSGGNKIEFRTYPLTTGTTADLVFTWSAGQTRSGCAVWALYGAGSEVPSNTQSSVADPSGTLGLVVPAKGVGLGVSFAVQGTSTTWTGLTERFDTAIESTVCHSGADINSNAGGTINTTIDWNGVQSTQPVHALVAFGP